MKFFHKKSQVYIIARAIIRNFTVGELCIRDVSDANVECSELYCQMLMIVRLKGEGGLSLLPPIINTIYIVLVTIFQSKGFTIGIVFQLYVYAFLRLFRLFFTSSSPDNGRAFLLSMTGQSQKDDLKIWLDEKF